ncbi:MAG: putative metal-binding motif-containing protein [Deltaproteobacteria bacterium]|nr:putative metal-binding motif-containing protein [Deltaproteobacteria bacterium]
MSLRSLVLLVLLAACDKEPDAPCRPAPEVCDGLDNDCSGLADDVVHYLDLDGDGFGDDRVTARGCSLWEPLWVAQGGDCDPLDPHTHPGAEELCDGHDRDCDGALWEGDETWWSAWYQDADGDGLGVPAPDQPPSCEPPPDSVPDIALDCDDALPGLGAGATRTVQDHGARNFSYTYGRADCSPDSPMETMDTLGPYYYRLADDDPWTLHTEDYHDDGDIDLRMTQTLDSQCRPLRRTEDLDDDGVIDAVTEWTWDDRARTRHITYDLDGDGTVDEAETEGWALLPEEGPTWFLEQDTDGDHLVDYRYTARYDADGHRLASSLDQDGDGRFESHWEAGYEDQRQVWLLEDLDGDGTWDRRTDWTWAPRIDSTPIQVRGLGNSIVLEEVDDALDGLVDARTRWTPDHTLLSIEEDLDDDGLLVRTWPADCVKDGSSEHCVDDDGLITLTWDDQGRLLTLMRDRDRDGDVDYRLAYTWDDQGRILTRQEDEDGDGVLYDHVRWTYDTHGRLQFMEMGTLFDGALNQRGSWTYHLNGALATYSSTTSDASGQPWYASEQQWDSDGPLTMEEYTRDGLTQQIWYDDDGHQTETRLVLPEHDLDVTVSLDSDSGAPGAVRWDRCGGLYTAREGAGWGLRELGLRPGGMACASSYYPYAGTTYSSGVERTGGEPYLISSWLHFPSGLIRYAEQDESPSGDQVWWTGAFDLGNVFTNWGTAYHLTEMTWDYTQVTERQLSYRWSCED